MPIIIQSTYPHVYIFETIATLPSVTSLVFERLEAARTWTVDLPQEWLPPHLVPAPLLARYELAHMRVLNLTKYTVSAQNLTSIVETFPNLGELHAYTTAQLDDIPRLLAPLMPTLKTLDMLQPHVCDSHAYIDSTPEHCNCVQGR
jgi:hypothetical protein